ncbi:Dimethylamine corrinoid protein 2 [Desulfamplus magnetovallimortis]|uniref:Dimethylamine corrinoid protein 2 n=1 Tax=Desulfamplus magnetovallimortis TaxID=1246637 RepID=A0A1W1HHG9_9BACT|nr:corrinoid protein [Desulfamplus magnetovallimortis]SLM31890.1 Dimethylamine corrinoid protein 2 [Desulfamplus magnetovallimortis]
MTKDKEILDGLADAVLAMDEKRAKSLAEEVIKRGVDIREAVLEGLSKGMEEVGRNYNNGTYFVSEMLLCSDAMNAAFDVFKPHLKGTEFLSKGRDIIIGVVQGDIHDIGKNLVKVMLESVGFTVHDLGTDVPLERFIEDAQRVNARIICLSTLMTTSMCQMERFIQTLEERGIRDRYKILVGGSPVTQSFADAINADGYADDAFLAAKKARELMET